VTTKDLQHLQRLRIAYEHLWTVPKDKKSFVWPV
jgi:hypothetical protein